MNKDGSFPLEAERGAKSLSYQAKTIMGLFKTAHMAEIQGYDLWNKKLDKDWQNLHHAITFLLNGFEDQSTVWKYAKKNQSAGNTKKYKEQDLRYFQEKQILVASIDIGTNSTHLLVAEINLELKPYSIELF